MKKSDDPYTLATLPCGARISIKELASVEFPSGRKDYAGAERQAFVEVSASCDAVVEHGLAACPRLKALMHIGKETNPLALARDVFEKGRFDDAGLPAVVGVPDRQHEHVPLRRIAVNVHLDREPSAPDVAAEVDDSEQKPGCAENVG